MNDDEAIERIMADEWFPGVFAYCCTYRQYNGTGRHLTYDQSRNPPHALVSLNRFGRIGLYVSDLDVTHTKRQFAELILNSIAMQAMQP